MHVKSKFLISGILIFLFVNSYGIQVNVQSTSSKIDGLGFTVNGKKQGGMGSKYQARNMPSGSYTFGLRKNGKDIGCTLKNGKKEVELTQSSNVILSFNGQTCTVNVTAK